MNRGNLTSRVDSTGQADRGSMADLLVEKPSPSSLGRLAVKVNSFSSEPRVRSLHGG
jgi:hypothetical protein